MTYYFEQNEFTSWELLQYVKLVYGRQLNGAPFTTTNLYNWIRQKKLPELYGDYKIIKTERYKELGNLLVITLEGLTREQMFQMVGNPLSKLVETHNKRRAQEKISKTKRPKKQRTRLYYQILRKAGKQYNKFTLKAATIPNYFKEAGGKRNQLVNKKRKK